MGLKESADGSLFVPDNSVPFGVLVFAYVGSARRSEGISLFPEGKPGFRDPNPGRPPLNPPSPESADERPPMIGSFGMPGVVDEMPLMFGKSPVRDGNFGVPDEPGVVYAMSPREGSLARLDERLLIFGSNRPREGRFGNEPGVVDEISPVLGERLPRDGSFGSFNEPGVMEEAVASVQVLHFATSCLIHSSPRSFDVKS